MVRRLAAAAGVVTIAACWLLAAATPAGATLDGPCEAQGTSFPREGADPDSPPGPLVVDADASGTITVPDVGEVHWQGAIGGGGSGDERSYSGNVVAQLPPVLDPIFGDALGFTEMWTWSGDAAGKEQSGVETYEIPSWAPRGVTVVFVLASAAGVVTTIASGVQIGEPS